MSNIATEGNPKPGLCPTLISHDFKGFFYSAQYHRQHNTLHALIYSQPVKIRKNAVPVPLSFMCILDIVPLTLFLTLVHFPTHLADDFTI